MKKLLCAILAAVVLIPLVLVLIKPVLPPQVFGFRLPDPKYQGALGEIRRAWDQALGKAMTADERRQIAECSLKFAETQGESLERLTALCWTVMNAPSTEPGKKALALLRDGRLTGSDLSVLVQALRANQPRPNAGPTPLAPLVLDLIVQTPDHPHAAELLIWVCMNYFGDESTEDSPTFARAGQIITDQFADSPAITYFCECLGSLYVSPPWAWKYEKHLRTILDKNQHRRVRVPAQLALASVVQRTGESLFG